jgi:hypothetical protein
MTDLWEGFHFIIRDKSWAKVKWSMKTYNPFVSSSLTKRELGNESTNKREEKFSGGLVG